MAGATPCAIDVAEGWTASTAAARPGERGQTWRAALDSFTRVSELHVDSEETFSGRLEACRLHEDLLLVRLAAHPNHVVHHLAAAAHGRDTVFVMTCLRGGGAAAQHGRWVDFAAGDTVFRSSIGRTELRLETPTIALGVAISRSRLARSGWSWPEADLAPLKAAAGHPISRAIKGMCLGLANGLTSVPSVSAPFVESAFVHLWLAWANASGTNISAKARVNERQWAAMTTHVEALLSEPDLRLEHVARAAKCSPRTVQKVFAGHRTTFERYVLQRRLDLAEAQMRRVGKDGTRIIDIAYACGFSELSHFSRRFKERFGVSPRAYCRPGRISAT